MLFTYLLQERQAALEAERLAKEKEEEEAKAKVSYSICLDQQSNLNARLWYHLDVCVHKNFSGAEQRGTLGHFLPLALPFAESEGKSGQN